MKTRSNLDNKEYGKLTFLWGEISLSYLPEIGFAAAKIAVLAFNLVVIPALASETVYYSITSWIATLSYSSILSNSSIQQIPWSASTNAPPSNRISSFESLYIEAVSPVEDDPFPVAYTPLGVTFAMYFNNYDLATPGSPMSAKLRSPLILIPSSIVIVDPPTIIKSKAFLTSFIPKISGAIEFAILSIFSLFFVF